MRIAIVGSGIAGLTAAYFLHRFHEITVFEAADYVGGHTHTVDVLSRGQRYAIDTGFIVFNQRNYPYFCRLLDDLGVASQPTSMSFSFRCDRSGLEYRGADWGGLFAQRRNLLKPKFYRMLADILRFNRLAKAWNQQATDDLSLDNFIEQAGLSEAFREWYLYPMGAAIWSCPRSTFADFPVRFVIRFFENHGLLDLRGRPQWRVVRGGSRRYVERMIQGFRDRIRLRAAVRAIQSTPSGERLASESGTVGTFDHVVLACHSDQALRLLGADASPLERQVLSCFPYEQNTAVLHTDTSLLPRRRAAWASWNYRAPREGSGKICVSYNMNLLQGLRARQTFCVTLNPWKEIPDSKVLGRFQYSHPVFGVRRAPPAEDVQALHRLASRSYCGAYWGNGFHEDGVTSALRVCRKLLDQRSWKAVCTKVGYNMSDESPCDIPFATSSV